MLNMNPLRIHPLADQLLLDIELEKHSPGGIELPANAPSQLALPVGRVIAIGSSVTKVAAGDRVLVSPRDVVKVDTLLWLAPESKLLAKVDPPSVIERR